MAENAFAGDHDRHALAVMCGMTAGRTRRDTDPFAERYRQIAAPVGDRKMGCKGVPKRKCEWRDSFPGRFGARPVVPLCGLSLGNRDLQPQAHLHA